MGWARANILFDRMDHMPESGSPMEVLLLLVWRMRQEIEFHKSRAIVQALMSQQGVEGEHVKKAFEDLRAAFFPYEEGQRKERSEEMRKVMLREINRGAIRVQPTMDMNRRVTVSRKLEEGAASLAKMADLVKEGRLRQLDKDPLKEARRRKRKQNSASSTKPGPAQKLARPTTPGKKHSPV